MGTFVPIALEPQFPFRSLEGISPADKFIADTFPGTLARPQVLDLDREFGRIGRMRARDRVLRVAHCLQVRAPSAPDPSANRGISVDPAIDKRVTTATAPCMARPRGLLSGARQLCRGFCRGRGLHFGANYWSRVGHIIGNCDENCNKHGHLRACTEVFSALSGPRIDRAHENQLTRYGKNSAPRQGRPGLGRPCLGLNQKTASFVVGTSGTFGTFVPLVRLVPWDRWDGQDTLPKGVSCLSQRSVLVVTYSESYSRDIAELTARADPRPSQTI